MSENFGNVAEMYHTLLSNVMAKVEGGDLAVEDIERIFFLAGVYQISMTEWSLKEAQKHRELVELLFARQTEAMEAMAAAVQRMAN